MQNNSSNEDSLLEDEDESSHDLSPFEVDWLDLEFTGCQQKLGICGLPGCRFKNRWRNLTHDIQCLKQDGIQDIFCLCTKGEFYKYRTQDILDKYSDAGFIVHHYPIEDGQVPVFTDLMKIVEDMRICVISGRKTIIHCFGGLGRSCVVAACLMMVLDENLSYEEASQKLKALRGNGAIQSVKQYNLVTDFRDLLTKFRQDSTSNDSRSLSR
ncbi:cyclin-dependent kinase inhibitor 3-like [Physella acuta]|uniref:cyclin-dependent kinase inhibitor 3-like n=1 Tax=Physella acuta TaxID=109671 RepID=UPI0027DADD09|nr:cyclin-dependent kinase inhibitor 3-like [Physella acuta]